MSNIFDSLTPLEQTAVYAHVLNVMGNEDGISMVSRVQRHHVDYLVNATEAIASNPDALKQVVSVYKSWLRSQPLDEQAASEHIHRYLELVTNKGKPEGRSS